MKLCWDNINNIKLTKNGNFWDVIKKKTYHYHEHCLKCGEEFLGRKNGKYCSIGCINKGRKASKETRKKMSNSGKKRKGENTSGWKGGYRLKNIPTYDTYAHQIEWCEEVRRNKEDTNILEVRCFKCGKWFIPIKQRITDRITYLKGNTNIRGERRFYCSNECRNSCSIFGKSPEQIMKEDTVRAGRLPWLELGREVQPELRKMVIERDGYVCQRCGATVNLQCHHIYPVATNPLESADIDNCIMYCIECHLKAHEKEGCRRQDLIKQIC